MVYCNYCTEDVDVEVDDANGFSCCVQCGRVLEDTAFSADVTFAKDAGGESTVVGQFVSDTGVARGLGRIHGGRVYAYQADSHEKAQQRGRQEISHLVDQLGVRPREESVEAAHRLYKIALQRGFTRGRRTNQVAAACLYLVCRQDSKPFLLIDFSDSLQVNVFTLGAVFLQLAKLLRLTEHPMFAKPVDPSLYIHRFADRLDFGRSMHEVANTALRLVASMKRDWIQTGRRPSGICGAAIYIAAHIHGFERSIRDIVSVVHIGEHTLSKRLYEFSSTSASLYTAEEFKEHAEQIDTEEAARLEEAQPAAQPAGLLEASGCEHLRMGEAHFAHAMCRACYLDFLKTSGGVYNGANPPAYDRNRKKEVQTLALEGPDAEGEEGGDAFDREEQDITAEMRSVFHQSELQQFAAFLPSSAEEAAAEAEGAAAAAARQARRGQEAAAKGAGGKGRKRKAAEPAEQQQQQQGAGGPASQEAQQQQQQQQEQQQQAGACPASPTAAAAAAGVGPSQLSDQTGAPAAAGAAAAAGTQQTEATAAGTQQPGEAGGAAAAAAAGEPSQFSDQTAAQRGGEGEQGEGAAAGGAAAAAAAAAGEGGTSAAAATAGAIVPVPEEKEGPDSLSDIDEDDILMYLADEAEVKCKEEIWNMMNRDWMEKQAAKKAAQEAAERIAAEHAAAQEAADAAGVQFKRGRGRPTGSRTRSHRAGVNDLPPAETAQEAAMRMLDHRKLSSKINYSALAGLFADDGGAEEGGDGEPPSLAAEALEGEEDDGRGAAVTAALRERRAAAEEEERAREARQAAALEAERSKARKGGKGRVGGLGLAVGGKLGGGGAGGSKLGSGSAGPLSPRASGGGLLVGARRPGGLGSLRDGNFRSQLSGATGATTGAGGTGAASAKKSVRFAE